MWGKHRTEVTEATEGEVGLVAEGLERTSGLPVREPGVWGKHRTEVTEGEGMEGCRGRVRLRPNRDVEWWSGGVVEWWSGGVVEWWSGGVVEWWSGGVAEWSSAGVLECSSASIVLRTPPRHRPSSSFADRAGLLG